MTSSHFNEHHSRGNFWLTLALLVLAGAGFLSYQWWLKLDAMVLAAKTSARIETTISPTVESVTTAYQNEKADADTKADTIALALASIFPSSSEETSLTRMFDSYVAKHDYTNSPLFLESLTLGGVATNDTVGAAYIPVELSLTGSRDNFFGFLNYVENSGALDGQVRLMDIAEVSVNIQDSEADEETGTSAPMVNFSVSIRAYFQQLLGSAPNE